MKFTPQTPGISVDICCVGLHYNLTAASNKRHKQKTSGLKQTIEHSLRIQVTVDGRNPKQPPGMVIKP